MAKKMESIITRNMTRCMVCHSPKVQIHHVFYGTANRKISDRLGLIVPLCLEHHTGKQGVHFNKEFDLHLKQQGQACYEAVYGSREDFVKLFGRNYLSEVEDEPSNH